MRNRLLTGLTCSLALVASFGPAALAESPPHSGTPGELAVVPTDPEPPENPCAPLDCDDIPIVIIGCLDLNGGCEEPPEFELCLNPGGLPCDPVEPPNDEIDDLLDPSGVDDPGGDDGEEEEEPVEPELPEEPDPVEPTPEEPTPTEPTPEEPAPADPTPADPTPQEDASDDEPAVTPVDIDAPRPGNPNFAG